MKEWYQKTKEESLNELDCKKSGLTSSEVAERFSKYGENVLEEGKKKRGSKMYLKKLWLKLSKPKEGKRYLGTGNTEGPK